MRKSFGFWRLVRGACLVGLLASQAAAQTRADANGSGRGSVPAKSPVEISQRASVGMAGTPAAHPGWPKNGLVNSEMFTVMDLDGNGSKEIIVPVFGSINLYNADGTAYGPGTCAGLLAWPSGPVSVGDIDGDGKPELGAISKSGTSSAYPEKREICFWHLDGTKCAGWPISTVRENDLVPHTLAPTVVDVDGDGVCEVLFPSVAAKGGYPLLHLVRGNGTPLPGWPVTLTSSLGAYIHDTAGAADLDGDGVLDFVVADSSGKVYAFNLQGQSLPGWPRTIISTESYAQEVTLTDLDRDGRTDVIVSFYNGTTAVLDHKGDYKTGWPRNLGSIPRPAAIADLDGDGLLEFAVGTQAGTLHLLRFNGAALPGWPKTVTNRVYSPTFADLNGDGKLDILTGDGSLIVYAWQLDGTDLSALGFPFRLPGTFGCYSAPVAEDLDNNGKLELVIEGEAFEVRDLAASVNRQVPACNFLHGDAANTCRAFVPCSFAAGQKLLTDQVGGNALIINGRGFLAGSKVRVGNQAASVTAWSANVLTVAAPANLPVGWQSIQVTHPNSASSTLTSSVLVVADRFGDTDGDGLPDQWEWAHGTDPLVKNAATSPGGMLGDPDGDGLCNLVEAAFAASGLDPATADTSRLPTIQFFNGHAVANYRRESRSRMAVGLTWSPDLVRWFNPGDVGYPTGMRDDDLGTAAAPYQDRRIDLPLPAGGRGFVRWRVAGVQ